MNSSLKNDLSQLTVLLIDDDMFIRDSMMYMLESLGINNVIEADSGRQAIELYEKNSKKPDLIICDIYMPEMDGFEVAMFMIDKSYQGGIIFLTGNNPAMLRATAKLSKAKGLNIVDVIEKPIKISHLETIIKKYTNT